MLQDMGREEGGLKTFCVGSIYLSLSVAIIRHSKSVDVAVL